MLEDSLGYYGRIVGCGENDVQIRAWQPHQELLPWSQ